MKDKLVYQCTNCKAIHLRWAGKCSSCESWNTLVPVYHKEVVREPKKSLNENPLLQNLEEISISEHFRIPSTIFEVDRVLGGGFVPSSVVLIAGEPGIGKSTLILQLLHKIDEKVIYISGEESPEQVKLRSKRLGLHPTNIFVASETNIDYISAIIENEDARIIAIDSIQTVYAEEINSPAGSIIQLRETTQQLLRLAKRNNKILILIGHVNKEGNIAGPKALEHIVDAVLVLEGDKISNLRILRALKNRFGSTQEIGLLEMTESGLVEMLDTSKIFIQHLTTETSGIVFTPVVEGGRCFIMEIQSLVSGTSYNFPQRNINGYDFKRLQMILAVLDKKMGLNFKQSDVFVNLTGGISIYDTGVDFAIAGSLVSSFYDLPIPKNVILIGEIGLAGEIRNVPFLEKRIIEAEKLGFTKAFIPKTGISHIEKNHQIKLILAERINEVFKNIFG
ncbi:MAG: DNA repair protein RadA [Ignavibacteria bacterium]|nr:DNA repair protein RadA [Ignavibacteria bacterium]